VLGGSALALIVINLILSFTLSNISVGGHIGGLIGGILCTLVLSKFGRGHAAYSPVGLWGVAGVAGVAVLSIVVALYAA
jgi:rhomboid protease GluP